MTANTAPINVTGAPAATPNPAVSSPSTAGQGAPNLFNALIHRAQSMVNIGGPVSDRVSHARPLSAPSSLLMATDELGGPIVVGSVRLKSEFFCKLTIEF